ncbi:MAG: glycosyltransferase family 2 protein [Longimicrobiales bacterium]
MPAPVAAPMPSITPRLSDRARRDFTVVVPAYNEVENVADLVRELKATFHRHNLEGTVLLVDDGSTDGTGVVASEFAADWPALHVLHHRRNRGKTEAMVTAADATDRQWLILFDADLQHSTEDIPRYLEKLDEGWDIVTGRKIGPYEKRLVSSAYNRLSRKIFNIPVSDTNSMKGFRRSILDEVHLRHDWHRFFVVLAYAQGYSATEIDIALFPRVKGEAKYAGKGRIVVGLLDLVSVAFFLFFSRKPLLLFGVTGMISTALGLLVGIAALVLRFGFELGFRPLLTLVVLLLTLGVIAIGFGFVAELIAQQQAELDSLRRKLDGAARPSNES